VTISDRRRFLAQAATAAGALGVEALGRPARAWGAPALVTADAERPAVVCGPSVGDVSDGRAVVWARADRPARLLVEYATSDSFRDAQRVVGPAALEDADFTARVELSDLPAGRPIFYRVRFQDLSDLRTFSAESAGRFRSAPAEPADLTFAWSADTVGQGYGINPDWGGLRLYDTLRRAAPDFFIHSGDSIYADNPLVPELRLDDGTVWKNVVTEAKSKVAETLEEFRGNHRYNWLDENLRRFAAEVPQIGQWDDHEVRNNWYPTQVLDDPRYRVKSVALLSARSRRAFLEYTPMRLDPADPERIYRAYAYGPLLEIFVLDMRSYRGPNSPGRQTAEGDDTAFMGARQVRWLRERLARSKAVWKVIASDMPLGLVVADGERDFEAVANGDPGPPLGRELELAGLLRSIRDNRVANVVWITADVHYAAAHYYDPRRARFTEFLPFWEFVAGPLHAGTFGPNVLDPTFGPEVRFCSVPAGMKLNRPPSEGRQYFGTVRIEARTRVMTVRLHDLSGDTLFEVALPPAL
jgi:alkaline phosphatase D